jgi:putative membrane protein
MTKSCSIAVDNFDQAFSLPFQLKIMNDPDSNPPPPNIQAELARERNRAAAERTLMAWIRTSLSLIGFGFGIDRIVAAIHGFDPAADINPVRLSRILGLAYIFLGIYAMVFATVEHLQQLRQIQEQGSYFYRPRRSLGLTVAVSMICIGVFAFVGILVKSSR